MGYLFAILQTKKNRVPVSFFGDDFVWDLCRIMFAVMETRLLHSAIFFPRCDFHTVCPRKFGRSCNNSLPLGQMMIYLSDLSTVDHNLVHHLPLCKVVQDLSYRADPNQETCAEACGLHRSHPATRARSYRSYRYRKISASKNVNRAVGIDFLSEV